MVFTFINIDIYININIRSKRLETSDLGRPRSLSYDAIIRKQSICTVVSTLYKERFSWVVAIVYRTHEHRAA